MYVSLCITFIISSPNTNLCVLPPSTFLLNPLLFYSCPAPVSPPPLTCSAGQRSWPGLPDSWNPGPQAADRVIRSWRPYANRHILSHALITCSKMFLGSVRRLTFQK